jgi:hypothetical protein
MIDKVQKSWDSDSILLLHMLLIFQYYYFLSIYNFLYFALPTELCPLLFAIMYREHSLVPQ